MDRTTAPEIAIQRVFAGIRLDLVGIGAEARMMFPLGQNTQPSFWIGASLPLKVLIAYYTAQ
jgi:hypothetical protein